jgi:hypothetical protein
MKGNILKPLNILKIQEPDLYRDHVKKYQERESVMNQRIPTLDCLWNDVLHFSAILPQEIKDALVDAGMPNNIMMTCYQIPAELLESEKTTIYFSVNFSKDRMNLKNFTNYVPKELIKYSRIPKETIEYYKESYCKNERSLVFNKIPHILYKGSLTIKDFVIIEV